MRDAKNIAGAAADFFYRSDNGVWLTDAGPLEFPRLISK